MPLLSITDSTIGTASRRHRTDAASSHTRPMGLGAQLLTTARRLPWHGQLVPLATTNYFRLVGGFLSCSISAHRNALLGLVWYSVQVALCVPSRAVAMHQLLLTALSSHTTSSASRALAPRTSTSQYHRMRASSASTVAIGTCRRQPPSALTIGTHHRHSPSTVSSSLPSPRAMCCERLSLPSSVCSHPNVQ